MGGLGDENTAKPRSRNLVPLKIFELLFILLHLVYICPPHPNVCLPP